MIGAISSSFLWFKVLDWLRLFDQTAFFIKLIFSTITGIGYFVIIMFIWYMLFGTAFYLLNLSRVEDEAASVIDPITGMWIFDSFFNQFEITLGEYKLGEF